MLFASASFGAVISNPGFDDDVLSDGGWGGCPSSWTGTAARQNLSAADGLDPEAQSGDNVAILNQGSWITSSVLTDELGNNILVESNKAYEVSVWVGRRTGDCGTYAGILKAWLSCDSVEDSAGTLAKIDSETFDMDGVVEAGQWEYVTFTLETGSDSSYAGESLLMGFDNITDRAGSEIWKAQIVIDSIAITEVPEPASMLLLGLGGLLIKRRK